MRNVVLMACASRKLERRANARDLYDSPLFKKSLHYAEKVLLPDVIYVLSAEHGLLPLDQEVAPYDRTLNRMRAAEVRDWSARVLAQLREVADLERDRFTFLAGEAYRNALMPHLRNVQVPMAGLGIGNQLRFLAQEIGDE